MCLIWINFCSNKLLKFLNMPQFIFQHCPFIIGLFHLAWCLSIYLLVDMGCFYLLAIVNNATMNTHWHTSICLRCCFQLFCYLPRRGIAGSYGNYIFSFLSNHQAVFCSGCTILHSCQQCKSVLISLHSHQYLLFSNSHPNGGDMRSRGFDLYFHND